MGLGQTLQQSGAAFGGGHPTRRQTRGGQVGRAPAVAFWCDCVYTCQSGASLPRGVKFSILLPITKPFKMLLGKHFA